MKIQKGELNGKAIVTLINNNGMQVTLGALGAGIVSVKVPDRAGTLREVTKLSPRGYGFSHNGLTVGRTAGRIAGAEFTIDGKTAKLEKNNHGTDNLHGGKTGLSYVEFSVAQKQCADHTDVVFEYVSPDGEWGYFGDVRFVITYRLSENENKLAIIFEAFPDCKTLVNLTNHVYFNASGDMREDVKNQIMYLNAARVGVLNERSITVDVVPVTREFDFTAPHAIGEYLNAPSVQKYSGGYDHPFGLNVRGMDALACSLYSESSGIEIKVKTTYPYAVVYTDNADGNRSVCFECQYHPDGIHAEPDDCGVCSPEKPYREVMEYEFCVK